MAAAAYSKYGHPEEDYVLLEYRRTDSGQTLIERIRNFLVSHV